MASSKKRGPAAKAKAKAARVAKKKRKQPLADPPQRISLRLAQATGTGQDKVAGGVAQAPESSSSFPGPSASEAPSVSGYHTRSSGKSLKSLVKVKASALGRSVQLETEEDLVKAISDLHYDPDPPAENQVEFEAQAQSVAQSATSGTAARTESIHIMTTRNKPRQGYAVKEDQGDSQEEQALWNQIQADLRKCATIQKKQIAHTERIREIHDIINKNANASSKLYEEMDTLTREVLKLTEEEKKLLNDEPTDIIRNIEILTALRAASSNDTGRAASPAARSAKDKQRKHKGSGSGGASGGRLDGPDGIDSPGPSPIAGGRLKNSVRSNSVALGRESRDIKIEDGDAGGRSAIATEGSKGPSAEKAGKFFVGAEVAYKQAKPKEDGSQWIQCTILSITERNGKKRYEVQDPEPDETGAPGDIYTASASALIAIPPAEAELGELPVGKAVLARYPETTTFYRAEVTGYVASKGLCRLKFEDDQNQEMEVDRRFVLSLDK